MTFIFVLKVIVLSFVIKKLTKKSFVQLFGLLRTQISRENMLYWSDILNDKILCFHEFIKRNSYQGKHHFIEVYNSKHTIDIKILKFADFESIYKKMTRRSKVQPLTLEQLLRNCFNSYRQHVILQNAANFETLKKELVSTIIPTFLKIFKAIKTYVIPLFAIFGLVMACKKVIFKENSDLATPTPILK